MSIEQFQKISIPTLWKVIGNSEGVGVSKTKIFKGKYGAKLEFLKGGGGGRAQTKKPSIGEVWIFSGTTPSEIRLKFLF